MKIFGLLAFMVTGILFGDSPKEFKLRNIATPRERSLGIKILGTCAGSFSALRALVFMYWNRDTHGDLHDNNLVVHGPDSVFLYTAIKYPVLQPLLPKIFSYYTKSTSELNEEELNRFLTAKEQDSNVILTYGDDIDVPLRLKDCLKEKGWSDQKIDAFLSKLTIQQHNSQEVIQYFRDYFTSNQHETSNDFFTMLHKKIQPDLYIPKGYDWTFERVEK